MQGRQEIQPKMYYQVTLEQKEVIEDSRVYIDELNEGSEYKVTLARKKLVERHHAWKEEEYSGMPGHVKRARVDEEGKEIRPKYLSNHTHYSPTDPDAKISVKPGKARQLNYSGQLVVDDAHHVITGACASTAGSKDSENLPEILDQTQANLASGGIKTDSKGYEKKQYRSSETVCGRCSLREQCCGKVTRFKKLEESIHKPYYDRMHQKLTQNPQYTRKVSKIRSRTVEPVLGTLINFLNMKKINSRGMKQANKHVLMAALTYNLKKYLKFTRKKVVALAHRMFQPEGVLQTSQNGSYRACMFSVLSY